MKNRRLFLLFFLSVVLAVSLDSCKKAEVLNTFGFAVDAKDFKDRIEKAGGFKVDGGAQIVDIRSRDLYVKGHIKGAVNIPMTYNKTNGDLVFEGEEKLESFDTHKPIFVYGDDDTKGARVASYMVDFGFSKSTTCYLSGGFNKWETTNKGDSSYEITTGESRW